MQTQMDNHERWLVDIESRVRFLENSLLGSAMSYHPEEEPQKEINIPEKPWNKRQWNVIVQLRGEMLNLKGKFLDLERLITSQGYKSKKGDRL